MNRKQGSVCREHDHVRLLASMHQSDIGGPLEGKYCKYVAFDRKSTAKKRPKLDRDERQLLGSRPDRSRPVPEAHGTSRYSHYVYATRRDLHLAVNDGQFDATDLSCKT